MTRHPRTLGGLRGGLAAAALAVLPGLLLAVPAVAQEAAPPAGAEAQRIEDLERQVEELRRALAEIAAAQRETAARAEAAPSAEPPAAAATDLAELERRIDLLAAEIERLALGDQVAPAATTEGLYGLAPAASKVYRSNQGLSIGGYGEMLYQAFDSSRDDGAPSGKKDELDFLRAILYFGYKFNDKFVFNSEIEVEHADEVFVEFAYLDYLHSPAFNVRGGMVLVPMGFVNELHEPTTFLGARRPDVEQVIIPTTWRENGFGLFGQVGDLSYRTYVVNGLNGSGFTPGGLRGGRQKGSHALAEDFAWVGRVDWSPTPGVVVGGSLYSGGSGQGVVDPLTGDELSVDTTLFEAHAEWNLRGLELRGLYAQAELDDVAGLNRARGLSGSASIGESLNGWYLQAGYDLWTGGERSLVPYVRWEEYDTQDEVPSGFTRSLATDVESLTLGLAFQPIDQIILKADYVDYDNEAGTAVDQINVALGYIF